MKTVSRLRSGDILIEVDAKEQSDRLLGLFQLGNLQIKTSAIGIVIAGLLLHDWFRLLQRLICHVCTMKIIITEHITVQ